MILEDVLCTLKDRVIDSKFVRVFYEYCELIQRDGITYPAYYVGKGDYDLVYDFDVNGAGYVRKNGTVSIDTNEMMMEAIACSDDDAYIDISYPMIAVLGVPKSKLGDSAYSDDKLFSEMAALFTGGYEATNVMNVATKIQSYETDGIAIYNTEVQGTEYRIKAELAYISIEFNITFTVAKSCLAEACGYGY